MSQKVESLDDWHEEARSLRLQTALRRRWLSFISVFAVGCVAALLMLFSVRWRATPCQFHTKHVELVMFAQPSQTVPLLSEAVGKVLSLQGLKLSPPTNNSIEGLTSVEQHSFLDTSTRQLRENSLELRYSLRSTIEQNYPYEYTLRYVSQDVCVDRPPFPLDSEYNVDEEYVSRSAKAVSDTDTTFYYFQSSVRSAKRNKMRLAADIGASFPSTRSLMMSGALTTSETCQVSTPQTGRVYFSRSGTPLPSLSLKMEQWRCCDPDMKGCRSFNAVRFMYNSLEEEIVATNVYRRLKDNLAQEGSLCADGSCGVPLYQA